MFEIRDFRIVDAERPYPAAEIVAEDGVLSVHRRFGSWLVESDGALRDLVFEVAEELQHLARPFDRARRREAEAEAERVANEPEPIRDWSAGDRVMWCGSKARVIGPSRQEGMIRIKCQKRVHHVAPTSISERSTRR